MQEGKIKDKIESIQKESSEFMNHNHTDILYLAGIIAASIDEHTKALNRIAAIMERYNGFGNMTEKGE